jgi:hypothetical protein
LVAMNDVQFVEAARHLAQRTMKSAGNSFGARLDFLALHALARPLEAQERAVVERAYRNFLNHYDARPEEAKKLLSTGESSYDTKLSPQELASWTMVASQILNLDEALNK